MTRDYAAELAIYTNEVAPTAGWPAMVELRCKHMFPAKTPYGCHKYDPVMPDERAAKVRKAEGGAK